jgi:peptidoglycan/LPS O-acetylase OafA/YrhL
MRRIAELDGLRGVAAVGIVAAHLWTEYLPGFWAAVDVFFVLSGYLITAIVLRHSLCWDFLKSFYLRRGLRIWPIYYLLVLLLTLAGLGNARALPYYLAYVQQTPFYWGGEMPIWILMEHTWTLALEERFYLIWPMLVLLAGPRRTGYLALAIALVAVGARGAGLHWWALLARCDGFALGGFLAVIMAEPDVARARQRARRWAVVFTVLAALVAALLIATGHLFEGFGPRTMAARATLASLGACILVMCVVRHAGHRALAPLRSAPLVYLGTISYGIYLYHYPIVKMSDTVGSSLRITPGPSLWAVECILTLVTAAISWHIIERPILRLKDRIPYRRGAVAAQEEKSSLHVPVTVELGNLLISSRIGAR